MIAFCAQMMQRTIETIPTAPVMRMPTQPEKIAIGGNGRRVAITIAKKISIGISITSTPMPYAML